MIPVIMALTAQSYIPVIILKNGTYEQTNAPVSLPGFDIFPFVSLAVLGIVVSSLIAYVSIRELNRRLIHDGK